MMLKYGSFTLKSGSFSLTTIFSLLWAYNPEALNIEQSLQPSHPTRPFLWQLTRQISWGGTVCLSSRPMPFFSGRHLQLVGGYHTAVHHREVRAKQSDLLCLQHVGQHHAERSQPPLATTSVLFVAPSILQQVSEETPGHGVRKHAQKAEENHLLMFNMPQVPLLLCWQHMLE